tara:strand:+ start:976 stop:1191 length:216 start_codon:yes stop_codon:yes gene_type:complete
MRIPLVLIALLTLSACATGTVGDSQYQRELHALEQSCRDRGGVLTSTGAHTGHPGTEFACIISGPATRIDR